MNEGQARKWHCVYGYTGSSVTEIKKNMFVPQGIGGKDHRPAERDTGYRAISAVQALNPATVVTEKIDMHSMQRSTDAQIKDVLRQSNTGLKADSMCRRRSVKLLGGSTDSNNFI